MKKFTFFSHVHPAGIEPTSTVPKTGTLSVELRVHRVILTVITDFANLTEMLSKTGDKPVDMCIKDKSLTVVKFRDLFSLFLLYG